MAFPRIFGSITLTGVFSTVKKFVFLRRKTVNTNITTLVIYSKYKFLFLIVHMLCLSNKSVIK